MFQFNYKLKVSEWVKAKCDRHPRYNSGREARGGIKGGCSTCFSLRFASGEAIARRRLPGVSRIALPWTRLRQPLAKLRSEKGEPLSRRVAFAAV